MEARAPEIPDAAAGGVRLIPWRESASAIATAGGRLISHGLAWILIAAVALNMANVISRYLFDRAILGAEEIQVFIMVWIAFVGCAVVAWKGEHLRMDICVAYLPSWLRKVLNVCESLLVLSLSGFMLYQSGAYTLWMLHANRNSDALGLPMAIPYGGLVIGFGLLLGVALLKVLGLRARAPHESTSPLS